MLLKDINNNQLLHQFSAWTDPFVQKSMLADKIVFNNDRSHREKKMWMMLIYFFDYKRIDQV